MPEMFDMVARDRSRKSSIRQRERVGMMSFKRRTRASTAARNEPAPRGLPSRIAAAARWQIASNWRGRSVLAGWRRAIFGLSFAIALVASPLATQVAPAQPAQEATEVCDPIDASACMLPWPNNYFTVADATTATGLRLNVSPLATPRNASGTPIEPGDWNRLDGFSPGSQIVTHVAGMDNPQAFANTNPPTNINIGRSLKRNSPVIVLDATTGKLWPVWAELDRSRDLEGNPPTPERTALLIHPAKNFVEGHRYIVALQNMRDSNGKLIPAASAFAAFLSGSGKPASRQNHYDADIFPQLSAARIKV
jgi:hypothetical protein